MDTFLILFLIAAVVAATLFFKGKSSGPSISRRVFLLGANYSGKTKLFHYLTSKETVNSVSSQTINAKVIDGVEISDYPGYEYFKRKAIADLEKAALVVYCVDSADKEATKTSASDLYMILTSLTTQTLVIYCNKQDLSSSKRAIFLETQLSSEIDKLRKSHIASGEEDLLVKSTSDRFDFAHLPNIKFVEGSIEACDELLSLIFPS